MLTKFSLKFAETIPVFNATAEPEVAAASIDCVGDDNDLWQSFLQSRDAEPGAAAASVDCVADDNDQWHSFLQSRDAEPGAAAASADCDQPRRGSPRHCIELSTCHPGQRLNI